MNKLYRQEKILKTLLLFRLKNYDFDYMNVEVYDTFEGGNYMCRLELFKGGQQIQNRIIKFESYLDETFVKRAENRLYIEMSR